MNGMKGEERIIIEYVLFIKSKLYMSNMFYL
jgi:hypothetical protein